MMEDERWTTKDKIDQFRGVTALYNSTNANIKEKTSALRKKQNKDIKNLTTQNNKFRKQYEDVLNGDKTNLLPVLHSHPKMQLAFKNLKPQQIEEELKQSIFCKNKELDRLRYKKKNLEDIFLNKKLELADLKKESEEAPENYLWEQEIANQIQSISVKQNAAQTNRAVYEKALNILKNDAIRFDEVLDNLRKDLAHQCESIVKAVEMGQNVSEELGNLQREYKATEKAVRANMKQRDRAIRNLRTEIDNIRLHGFANTRESRPILPSTSLRQAVPNLDDEDGSDTNMQALLDLHVKREIAVVEGVLNQIKEAALVHRVEDIFPRLDEQKRQRCRLQKQVEENEAQLAKMLELHNQLDVMLEVVMYHTMTDEAKQLKQDRDQLRKEIDTENENLTATKTELVGIGGKIVNIRTALLTLNMMLDTVYPGAEESVLELGTSVVSEMLTGQALKPLFQPNTEALTLMEHVTKKVRWLIEQVGSKDLEAKPMIAATLAREVSAVKLCVEDEADNIVSDMLDELEDLDDPSVLSRKDIKAESQRIVDLYDNPQRMFQDNNGPKFKKHKCF